MKRIVVLLLVLTFLFAGCAGTVKSPDPAFTPRPSDAAPTSAAQPKDDVTPAPTDPPEETPSAEPTDDPGVPGDVDDPEDPDEPEGPDIDPNGADGEGVLYAEIADWCEYEDVYLPTLNREYFGDEVALQVEADMLELYNELTRDLWDFEEEGGHGPSAWYGICETKDTVTVVVYYDEAGYGPEYDFIRSYCIDKEEKRFLDVWDLLTRYGMELGDLVAQVRDQRLAYYDYFKYNIYDFEEYDSITIEDCIDLDLRSLDWVLRETPEYVVAYDEDTLGICINLQQPGAGAGTVNQVLFVGDPDMASFLNAPYGADMYLLTNLSDEYLETYPPNETVILSDGEFAETCLFVNNYGDLGYRLDLMEPREDDDGNFHLAYADTLAEGSLGFADTMLLQVDRPEGFPSYRLVLIDGENSTEYIFSYNGRFGTLPVEYIASNFAAG